MLAFSAYFSIYSYIVIFLFFAFFIYTLDFYNTLTNSINITTTYTNTYAKINFFLFVGSLVGIPPLFGFFSKSIVFINLLLCQKYFYFVILLLINLGLMVFYLQQFRYLQSNFKKTKFLKGKMNLNYTYVFIVLGFQVFNLFAFFFTPFLFNTFLLSVLI